MERGSSKHSPRLDDQLTHALRSALQSGQPEDRTDESVIQEELLPDERAAVGPPSAQRPALAGQLGSAEIEQRSELARWLEPHLFPGDAEALLDRARERQAPDAVLEMLQGLPAGQLFPNLEAVWEALGGMGEHRG